MTQHPRGWSHEASEPEISIDTGAKEEEQDFADFDLVGERFGKYFIVGELATGGMAEVFLALQRGIEGFLKVVVLKRVLPQFSSDPEFVRLFVNEARIAARLEHPNIVRTYEFGEVNGQYFTTMEYLAGEDLSKALAKLAFSKQRIPVHIAAGIVSQVCTGLHFAHQLTDTAGRPLNLVHRDVNPANIIVTYAGEVKLIDFGVAKTDANKTVNSSIKGKISYMSPEQLVKRAVDARSDVFSTGILLWELLAGKPLFTRDSEAATLYAIMNDRIDMPSRCRPDVPRELDEIVGRALARSPAGRYGTAEEMGSALETFLASQPKYDARVLARMVEDLFSRPRAEAKRSIAQSRSLGRNVSLVMKLRTDIKTEFAHRLSAIESGAEDPSPQPPLVTEVEGRASHRIASICALVILACIACGVVYAVSDSDVRRAAKTSGARQSSSRASLQISSTPPGAAISVGGEPTGLKTPATITGLTVNEVDVRLELPDYEAVMTRVSVPLGGALSKHFTLSSATGRLVITQLASGSVVFVDGEEFEAGELIDVATGTHVVRIVLDGRTLMEQQIETTVGDQHWELTGDVLVQVDR